MRSLLFPMLLAGVLALHVAPAESRTRFLRWDDANSRLTGFLLQACLVTEQGECTMRDVQRVSPWRTSAQVNVPLGTTVKCFQVIAVKQKQQSRPSDRICLQE
jgi:hypothetical protein